MINLTTYYILRFLDYSTYGHPWLLFNQFWSFQTKVQFFQQINVKNDQSRVRRLDSNSRPLEYQSPPGISTSG